MTLHSKCSEPKKKKMNVDEGIQRIIEKLPGISGIGISGVSKVVLCC